MMETVAQPLSEVANQDRQKELAHLRARLARLEESGRPYYMLTAGVCVVGLGVAVGGAALDYWGDVWALIAVPFFFFFAVYSYFIRSLQRSTVRSRIEELTAGQAISTRLAEASMPESSGSYFEELVSINVGSLRSYYGLVKDHAQQSFMVSVVVGGLGFLLIALGVSLAFFRTDYAQRVAFLSAAAGIFTEFISGVFFFLYNRTVRQLKEYHDSLLEVQNILLSFKVLEDSSKEDKAKMVGQMLSYLLTRTGSGSAPTKAD